MIRLVEVCEVLNASNTSRQKYTNKNWKKECFQII